MLTVMISKLDHVVLELALKDAFRDMCFCEGEEFVNELIGYLNDIETGNNTTEQNTAFAEISIPYIENSIMVYCENVKDPHVGADFNALATQRGITGSDVNKITNAGNVKKFIEMKGLTEAEEANVYDAVSQLSYSTLTEAIQNTKAGTFLMKAKQLPPAIISGITTNVNKNFTGFKTGGKVAKTPSI